LEALTALLIVIGSLNWNIPNNTSFDNANALFLEQTHMGTKETIQGQ